MEYIRTEANGQLFLEPETKEYLNIPSCLYGFKNEETTTETALSGRKVFCFRGKLNVEEEERQCKCGKRKLTANPYAATVTFHVISTGS